MKLIEITFREAPRLPGIRAGDMIPLKCFEPSEQMRGWRALIRGASVFFVSPPGFVTGGSPHQRDANGPCVIHEIPRLSCYLHWSGTPEEISNVTKYDTPPFGPEPASSVAELSDAPAGTGKKDAPSGLLAQVGV